MFVKILKSIPETEFKVGDRVDVEEKVARAYIAGGLVEAAPDADDAQDTLTREALAGIQRSIADTIRAGIEQGRQAVTIEAGDQQADVTKSFDDFVQNVGLFQKYHDADAVERLDKVYRCQFTDKAGAVLRSVSGGEVSVGQYGGVLAPTEYATELLKLDPEMSVVADGVRQVPMTGPTKEYPVLRQTGTNAPTGGSAIHAGVVVYRKTEKGQRSSTRPNFESLKLEATDLTAYTAATRDLLADAPGAQSDFQQLIREALTWRMDHDFMFGGGDGEPLGIYESPACISVTRTTTSHIKYADFVNLMAKIIPQYWGRMIWVANVTAFPEIAQMQDGSGRNIFLPMLAQSGAATVAPAGTILGRPVKWSEKVPALGSAGDLALVVPPLYLHGMRAGVEIAVSEHFLFDTDQIAYRAKIRNTGQPWLKAPYRLADGSNTQVSGFAKLAA